MYISRFAPTPTGPLHFGSLVCALAGYLDARAKRGNWHLRIEDLDPPRTVEGSADQIIHQLDKHGLHWDGEIIYQSQRNEAYQQALDELIRRSDTYYCNCTRKTLVAQNGMELGFCQKHPVKDIQNAAVRMRPSGQLTWHDRVQGPQSILLDHEKELVLKRRDGLFAYPLAVVVDDIELGVTHLIRGSDLMEVAPGQQYLYQAFAKQAPSYTHIPVAANRLGQKLSKQNHAPGIDIKNASDNLRTALQHLGQESYMATGSIDDIISQAIDHWDIDKIPKSIYCLAPAHLALDY